MDTELFFRIDKPFDIAYRKDMPTTPVGPHIHNGMELYYTLTALPDVLVEDQVFNVPEKTLIVIPPYAVHQLYHESGNTYERYVININDIWLKNVFSDTPGIPSCFIQKTDPLILKFRESIIKKILFDSQNNKPMALAHLFELLAAVTEMKGSTGTLPELKFVSDSQKKVNEIISFIEKNIRENMNVSDVARHFYLNPDYLGRLFKQHTHVSLGRFLTLQKIAAAQEMLRAGKTVSEVSDELKYSSYAYFFKTFRKIAGISPSRYRALCQSEKQKSALLEEK